MKAKPPDRHQLAVGILAIATAAIGFGLFGDTFQLGEFPQTTEPARQIQQAKLAGIAATIMCYFTVLVTVATMLPWDRISGKQLIGLMLWLYLQMGSLTGLYILNVIEKLAGD